MVDWMKIKRKIYNLLVNSCDTVSYFFRHRIVFKKIKNMSAKKLNQKLHKNLFQRERFEILDKEGRGEGVGGACSL